MGRSERKAEHFPSGTSLAVVVVFAVVFVFVTVAVVVAAVLSPI